MGWGRLLISLTSKVSPKLIRITAPGTRLLYPQTVARYGGLIPDSNSDARNLNFRTTPFGLATTGNTPLNSLTKALAEGRSGSNDFFTSGAKSAPRETLRVIPQTAHDNLTEIILRKLYENCSTIQNRMCSKIFTPLFFSQPDLLDKLEAPVPGQRQGYAGNRPVPAARLKPRAGSTLDR